MWSQGWQLVWVGTPTWYEYAPTPCMHAWMPLRHATVRMPGYAVHGLLRKVHTCCVCMSHNDVAHWRVSEGVGGPITSCPARATASQSHTACPFTKQPGVSTYVTHPPSVLLLCVLSVLVPYPSPCR